MAGPILAQLALFFKVSGISFFFTFLLFFDPPNLFLEFSKTFNAVTDNNDIRKENRMQISIKKRKSLFNAKIFRLKILCLEIANFKMCCSLKIVSLSKTILKVLFFVFKIILY